MGRHRKPKRATVSRAALMLAASAAGLAAPAALPVAASASDAPVLAPAHPVLVDAPGLAPRPLLSRVTPAVRQQAAPASYTVRPGDSLTAVAARLCGAARDWLGIWHATGHIPDPNLIFPGRQLVIACNADGPGYSSALAAPVTTTTTADGKTWGVSYGDPNYCGDGDHDGWDVSCQSGPSSIAPAQQAPAAASSGSVVPGSSFEACVIARESGGNAQVMNSSGHYGLYQFSESTWVAYGGSAADFGHASPAEQHQVFANAIAQGGQSNWSPYDGC